MADDTKYYYVVAALNLVGLGVWSNEISGIPLTVPYYSLTTQINGSGSINNLNQSPVRMQTSGYLPRRVVRKGILRDGRGQKQVSWGRMVDT
jgi:hypothetical protein